MHASIIFLLQQRPSSLSLLAAPGRGPPHLLPGPHDLVDQQQLHGQDRRQVEALPLDAHVVPHALVLRYHRLSRLAVQSHRELAPRILPRVGELQYAILDVEAAVLGQGFGYDEEGLRVRLHAEFRASLGGPGHDVAEVHRRRDLMKGLWDFKRRERGALVVPGGGRRI